MVSAMRAASCAVCAGFALVGWIRAVTAGDDVSTLWVAAFLIFLREVADALE